MTLVVARGPIFTGEVDPNRIHGWIGLVLVFFALVDLLSLLCNG